MKYTYDFSKLRGRIKELIGSENEFARLLNVSHASLSAKLNSKVPFSISEIDNSIQILKIDVNDIYEYFFTKKVENISTN